jgi:Transglycosylase SLT domain
MVGLAALGAAAVIGLAALSALLTVIAAHGACSGPAGAAPPTSEARHSIPAAYLTLYEQAARVYGVPWPVLAAIGSIETDHGRSRAPGVRAGVNRHGCCAGPMQFNTRDGPPSTWERYGADANHDGTTNIYDPEDAIPAAANYLAALLRANGDNLSQAILAYNHSEAYLRDVLARARTYARLTDDQLTAPIGETTGPADCADVSAGPANLRDARRETGPRTFRSLPAWAMAGAGGSGAVDARLYNDVVWILRRYHLRVTAAREAGHHTHGDGTAVDLVPADGSAQAVWDASAGRLAHDLGWTPACARSGTRPACRLAPAIQFLGYDGYPGHGSPRTCTGGCPPHLHLSWASPCYGTSSLSPPCDWVMTFAVATAGYGAVAQSVRRSIRKPRGRHPCKRRSDRCVGHPAEVGSATRARPRPAHG